MLGFELFVAIVVVGPFSTSASEISAEPHLIPVAHFLAMVTSVLQLFQNYFANRPDHCLF